MFFGVVRALFATLAQCGFFFTAPFHRALSIKATTHPTASVFLFFPPYLTKFISKKISFFNKYFMYVTYRRRMVLLFFIFIFFYYYEVFIPVPFYIFILNIRKHKKKKNSREKKKHQQTVNGVSFTLNL